MVLDLQPGQKCMHAPTDEQAWVTLSLYAPSILFECWDPKKKQTSEFAGVNMVLIFQKGLQR